MATDRLACSHSRGRRHAEPATSPLDDFALDRHRVVHCAAFRRLEHKTQVFVTHEGDHYRTRLTHTLEVAAQAHRLAAAIGLNTTLAETIALAHDLGHPPFGHAGEAALAEKMADFGGFEHNRQSLRVVDYLEHPYPDFRGLNLTFELREGLLKHCTRYDHPAATPDPVHAELYAAGPWPTLEAQVTNLADEIAYTLHDIEDGLMHQLIDEGALAGVPLWRDAAAPWRTRHPDLPVKAIRRPVLDALLDRLIDDAAMATRESMRSSSAADADAVRCGPAPMVVFSNGIRASLGELQTLLRETIYRHEQVRVMDRESRDIVRRVFDAFLSDPSRLPPRFAARLDDQGPHRVICDYIAGMTDRFCHSECRRLCERA